MDPAEEYLKFMKHVETLVIYGIGKLEYREVNLLKFHENALHILARLQSSSAKVVFANAFSHLEPEVETALVDELTYITNNIGKLFESGRPNHDFLQGVVDPATHDRDLASDVKTGKDSLEDLLKKWLPDWIKNRLKILNEILKIVFKL